MTTRDSRLSNEFIDAEPLKFYAWIIFYIMDKSELHVLIMIAREIKLRENRRCVKNTQRLWMLVHL